MPPGGGAGSERIHQCQSIFQGQTRQLIGHSRDCPTKLVFLEISTNSTFFKPHRTLFSKAMTTASNPTHDFRNPSIPSHGLSRIRSPSQKAKESKPRAPPPPAHLAAQILLLVTSGVVGWKPMWPPFTCQSPTITTISPCRTLSPPPSATGMDQSALPSPLGSVPVAPAPLSMASPEFVLTGPPSTGIMNSMQESRFLSCASPVCSFRLNVAVSFPSANEPLLLSGEFTKIFSQRKQRIVCGILPPILCLGGMWSFGPSQRQACPFC